MRTPNRIIAPHEMSIILSEIGELPHDSVWEEVCAELHDVGYTTIEIEQIHHVWKLSQPQAEQMPIVVGVDLFGAGSFSAVPNFDPGTIDRAGVNLEIRHEFIEGLGVTALLASTSEAEDIAEAIRRAAAQTRGEDPDKAVQSHHQWLVDLLSGADGDHSKIYSAVQDAFAKDPGEVREAIVAAVCGIYEQLNDTTIPELMFDLTGDALGMADDLELDRG